MLTRCEQACISSISSSISIDHTQMLQLTHQIKGSNASGISFQVFSACDVTCDRQMKLD